MNKQQIMKDNKLIAEFMGANTSIESEDVQSYEMSWDWLMPVIEEIDHTSYEPIESIEDGIATRSLEMTHKAVVEYIKKYER